MTPKASKHSVRWNQVAAFRMARHHLDGRGAADLVTVCRDACGIQAQVMSAAEISLWARMHRLRRDEISAALWQRRTLVKTSCMRQTLHLIPAADFSLYIAALRRSRSAFLQRIMSKYASVTSKNAEELTAALVEALTGGPLTRRQLAERITPRVSKQIREWMKIAWGIMTVRPALVEGLICYGPEQGNEVTYVRVDQWLPRQKKISEEEAQCELLRRYLGAFGPATMHDFCKWSGIPVRDAKGIWDSLAGEFAEVSIEGQPAWLLRRDAPALAACKDAALPVRLLPHFDTYLLGHADKAHLVEARHYKRVYRAQGWISPVVLADGRIGGVWSSTQNAKGGAITIEFFGKPFPGLQDAIEEEAASLGRFLEAPCTVKYAK